jgi:hypothetical protein
VDSENAGSVYWRCHYCFLANATDLNVTITSEMNFNDVLVFNRNQRSAMINWRFCLLLASYSGAYYCYFVTHDQSVASTLSSQSTVSSAT